MANRLELCGPASRDMLSFLRQIVPFCIAFLLASHSIGAENVLFDSLITTGVRVSSDSVLRLAAPTMSDNLDAAEQKRLVVQVADGRHSYDVFSRNSVVAPFAIKIDNVAPSTEQASGGCRVDVWFVAYANLEKISEDQFLKQQFETETKAEQDTTAPKLVALSESDLAARNIKLGANEKVFAG